MIFRDILEVERTVRALNKKLKDKPKGYLTELKINGHVFSPPNDHKIEIILVDPQKKLVAYRQPLNGSANIHNNATWLFGDYEKAVKDAFAWQNKDLSVNAPQKNDPKKSRNQMEDAIDPELTLMGFF